MGLTDSTRTRFIDKAHLGIPAANVQDNRVLDEVARPKGFGQIVAGNRLPEFLIRRQGFTLSAQVAVATLGAGQRREMRVNVLAVPLGSGRHDRAPDLTLM